MAKHWWERLGNEPEDNGDDAEDGEREGTITADDLRALGGAFMPEFDDLHGGIPGGTRRRLGGRWRLPSQPPEWVAPVRDSTDLPV